MKRVPAAWVALGLDEVRDIHFIDPHQHPRLPRVSELSARPTPVRFAARLFACDMGWIGRGHGYIAGFPPGFVPTVPAGMAAWHSWASMLRDVNMT
jgi:hypothetical protein